MPEVLGAAALLLVTGLALLVLLTAFLGGLQEWRSWRFLIRALRRVRPVTTPPAPVRSLGELATDTRRISQRFHAEGLRFAKYEGVRRAFDQKLAEVADMLEHPHLLGVLETGAERDLERTRVESLLVDDGVLAPQRRD